MSGLIFVATFAFYLALVLWHPRLVPVLATCGFAWLALHEGLAGRTDRVFEAAACALFCGLASLVCVPTFGDPRTPKA